MNSALQQARTRVVLDHQRTRTLDQASFSLPAATFAEGDGTLVSLEGRAQRFFQVFEPAYMRPEARIHDSWRWLHALSSRERPEGAGDITLDQVTAACAHAFPQLAAMVDAAPDAGYRIEGLQMAREPHRYSGRTSMRANQNVSEPRVPQDPDTAFAFSMEGYSGYQEARQQVPFAWAPGWNSPQAWNKFTDEVGGHLRGGDPGIRLLTPEPGCYQYTADIPGAAGNAGEGCQAVILPRLFGGEEMSARAEPIRERMERPVLQMAVADATRLGAELGGLVTVSGDNGCVTLPAQPDENWPQGLVGIPAGAAAAALARMPVTLTPGPGSTPEGAQES